MRKAIRTEKAPGPAGHYSQALTATGEYVFISGQTPRQLDGTRMTGATFDSQARRTLDNLQAVALASGLTLNDAVKITVFLRDAKDATEFNGIYEEYFTAEPLPARTLVQSSFVDFDLEVDAILVRAASQA